MTRRTRTYAALLGLLLAGLAAPAAEAGTYDVVSCGAPGAGGVNKSWNWRVKAFNGDVNDEDRKNFVQDGDCAGPNGLSGRTVGTRRQARYLTWGEFAFDAPAGTSIVKVNLWRYTTAYVSRDGNDADQEGGRWEVFAQYGDSQPFSESCKPGTTFFPDPCHTGAKGFSPASRSELRGGASSFALGILCGGDQLASCFTSRSDGTPNGSIDFQGAVVTLEDQNRPALTAGGDLFADGFRTAADGIVAQSSDSSGIRAVRLEVDGSPISRQALACDYRERVPCPTRDRREFSLADVPISDGEHTVALIAEDTAGNETRADKRVRIDANAPQILLEPLKGKEVAATVTDAGSGVASGSIEVRDPGAPAFRPLSAKLEGSRLSATLDKGSVSRVALRVTARDNAGRQSIVEGVPSRIAVTRARVGRRTRSVRGDRVRARARQAVTFQGTLRAADGTPLGGRSVSAFAALRRSGASPLPAGTATTDASGRFSLTLPAGPSRQVRLAFEGGGGSLPSAKGVSVRVPASSSIRASARSVRRGTRVRFSGRLATAGQPVPRSGKLVELQAFDRGRWRTFGSTRARGSRATWRASYRFGSRPGRYPIRLRIRRESSFPFELGYSRVLSVRVR